MRAPGAHVVFAMYHFTDSVPQRRTRPTKKQGLMSEHWPCHPGMLKTRCCSASCCFRFARRSSTTGGRIEFSRSVLAEGHIHRRWGRGSRRRPRPQVRDRNIRPLAEGPIQPRPRQKTNTDPHTIGKQESTRRGWRFGLRRGPRQQRCRRRQSMPMGCFGFRRSSLPLTRQMTRSRPPSSRTLETRWAPDRRCRRFPVPVHPCCRV